MFIPIVPSVTVVNKTIVYSDTVLPLKAEGRNLSVSSISGVSESNFENCLKIIFEANPDVTFNTIQYSKENKTVYFYTNKAISTAAYEEKKLTTYAPISSREKILEDVENILTSEKNVDPECISMYDVVRLVKRTYDEYNSIEEDYKYSLKSALEKKLDDSSFYFQGFDYTNMLMHYSFERYSADDWNSIYFGKQNGDLYVAKSDSPWASEIFSSCAPILSKVYDEYLKFCDFRSQCANRIVPINSSFKIRVNSYGVKIYGPDFNGCYSKEMELFLPSYIDEYDLKANSSMVNEAVTGKEDEILKRLYVKISDCPQWSQEELREIREKQLSDQLCGSSGIIKFLRKLPLFGEKKS